MLTELFPENATDPKAPMPPAHPLPANVTRLWSNDTMHVVSQNSTTTTMQSGDGKGKRDEPGEHMEEEANWEDEHEEGTYDKD